MKLDELVIDLVVVVSIVLSFRDVVFSVIDVIVGEVGLIGEVCWVFRIE